MAWDGLGFGRDLTSADTEAKSGIHLLSTHGSYPLIIH